MGPNYCTGTSEAKQWQDRDNRQFVCLRYFFMNISELVEQRVAVQEPPRIDKLLTLHFSCRVSSTHTRDCECFHLQLFGEHQ